MPPGERGAHAHQESGDGTSFFGESHASGNLTHARSSRARNAKSVSVRMPRNSKTGMCSAIGTSSTLIPFYSDEYCPHCDNHFVIEAKTPEARLEVEGDDARVNSKYVDQCLFLRRILTILQVPQGRTCCPGQGALPFHPIRYVGPPGLSVHVLDYICGNTVVS